MPDLEYLMGNLIEGKTWLHVRCHIDAELAARDRWAEETMRLDGHYHAEEAAYACHPGCLFGKLDA
jgi:hypothetical protein